MCNVDAHCTLGKDCHKWSMSVVFFFLLSVIYDFPHHKDTGSPNLRVLSLTLATLPFQF